MQYTGWNWIRAIHHVAGTGKKGFTGNGGPPSGHSKRAEG